MIHISEPLLGGDELKNLKECIDTNWISSQGRFVKEFEEKFAKWIGCKHGVATTSGTTALHLAVSALGLREDFEAEVIVPTLTFIATANVVRYCGAEPVFIDASRNNWNLDVEKIKGKINKNTVGIIPVHLYGYPCQIDMIMDIAKAYGLWVVEDCAEAHGAAFKGRRVGTFGSINCFSFYANKIITTGEGGMCLTDDTKLYNKMLILRDHGMSKTKKYWYDEIGFNYRMTNLQAAVGLAQLDQIGEFIQRRDSIKTLYDKLLPDCCRRPEPTLGSTDVCWMYTTLVDRRDELIEYLDKKGVETRPVFYPLNQMPPYEDGLRFPEAERYSEKGINLPTYPSIGLKTIKYIVDCIEEFYK